MPNEITVSNRSQLESSLAQSTGGETIKLQDGFYGSITISKKFLSKVTIEAINPLQVTFSDIDVPGGSNIHLDGLVIESQPRIDQNAHHVTISNSTLKNGLYFRDADNIAVDNNDISGGQNTLILNDVTNFTITENYIHHATADVVRITGASQYGLFENNTVYDLAAKAPVHPDLVQMFGNSSGNPTDITFRGNYLYDDPATGSVYAQGFFFGDPNNGGYKNILIEDNLINVGSPNSIAIHGGQENVVIQNNTLIPWPGGGGAVIRLTDARGWSNEGTTVRDNIAKEFLNGTNVSNVSGNYFYGRDADVSKLFSGDGSQWQDFVPVNGSSIDLPTGLGASNRLTDLLNGTSGSGDTGQGTGDDTGQGTGDDTGQGTGDDTGQGTGDDTGQGTGDDTGQGTGDDTGQGTGDDTGQGTGSEGIMFSMMGAHEFNGAVDVIEVAHNDDMALDAATISFSFNADTVSGRSGLISKDASYFTGGGNHLVSYIENGNLVVRFQDGSESEIAKVSGIQANTDYDLNISFGDNNVSIWLDDQKVHSSDFSTSWVTNVEYLQFGALGWSSRSGEAGFSSAFDGTISDIVIMEGNLTPTQVQTPPPSTDSNTVFELIEETIFDGFNRDVVRVEHATAYELQEGTISFTFNANDLNGTQGLVSKDAKYYVGGGNHISAMLKSDNLVFRFQDKDSDAVFIVENIEMGEEYDVQAWFGDGAVGLAVNGELIGTKQFDIDLSLNHQNLQVGGLGWGSKDGGWGVTNPFDGMMSNVIILDQAMSVDTGDLFV